MKLKLIKLAALIMASFIGITTLNMAPVFADDICNSTNASEEVKAAAGCPGTGTKDQLKNVVVGILNAIIGISSFIAVVFIIIGGINYMTSAGDPSKTKKAKDTIFYACIGLIVCVLAFAIVNFVILHVLEPSVSSSGST